MRREPVTDGIKVDSNAGWMGFELASLLPKSHGLSNVRGKTDLGSIWNSPRVGT